MESVDEQSTIPATACSDFPEVLFLPTTPPSCDVVFHGLSREQTNPLWNINGADGGEEGEGEGHSAISWQRPAYSFLNSTGTLAAGPSPPNPRALSRVRSPHSPFFGGSMKGLRPGRPVYLLDHHNALLGRTP